MSSRRTTSASTKGSARQKKSKTSDTSLRGIAFIVDDSDKGPKLVFRYPTAFGTSDNRDTSSLRGLTSNVLARPISNQQVAPLVLNPFVSRHTKAVSTTSSDDTNFSRTGAATSSPASSTTPSPKTKDPFGGLDTDLLAWMFRPKKVLCNQVFELEIDGTVFVSYPIVLETGSLRLFNVVFAIATGYTGPSVSLVNSYKAIAKRLATTLLHEENRCSYVSEEVQKMFRVWDELKKIKEDEEISSSPPSTSASASASSASVSSASASSSSSSSSTSMP